ncbi:MAG: hypothetical protein VB857_07810, partial [Pirellulaceae bacterium]
RTQVTGCNPCAEKQEVLSVENRSSTGDQPSFLVRHRRIDGTASEQTKKKTGPLSKSGRMDHTG